MREVAADRLTVAAAIVFSIALGAASAVVAPALFKLSFGGQFTWYAARSSGMVAYLLATASVVFGIGTSSRFGTRLGKGNLADIHRALSLLMMLAIGAHALFLALDSYAGFTVAELSVPFVTWYRPVWTGLGIIAAYLAGALYASFYIRALVGYRVWRAFHYLSFAVFGLGTLHGLFAGTDSGTAWSLAIYGTSVACVFGMLVYRVTSARADNTRRAGATVQSAQSTNARSRSKAIAEPLSVEAGFALREGQL